MSRALRVADLTDESGAARYGRPMDLKMLALIGFVVLAATVIAYFATR